MPNGRSATPSPRAMEALQKVDAHLCGVIVNGFVVRHTGYPYYGDYYAGSYAGYYSDTDA